MNIPPGKLGSEPSLRFTPMKTASRLGCGLLLCLYTQWLIAHPQPKPEPGEEGTATLDEVMVEGRATDLIGVASSASQGVVGQPEFKYRPLSRVGELVEVVPGTLATQHSGSGKANQYFLRGFNLDHGTDFTVMVDGVPMNMPTHAHGQGYLDLNSIIPELVDKVEFGKGPYYADVGDFSSAGYARMHTMHKLAQGFLKFTGGEYGYYRGVMAHSNRLGPGELLYAGEFNFYDGAWQIPENAGKYNGMLRYTIDRQDWGLSVNGKAYHNTWTATNQIPKRLVQSGALDPYGSMDPSDGGDTNRYSLSTNLWQRGDSWKNDFNVYALYSDLDLFSNFTYFLDNPSRGDQLNQKERRVQVGGNGEQTWFNRWFGLDMDNTLGFQIRHDEIMGLALNHSQQRQIYSTVREDDIGETSVGVYLKNQTQWLKKFRTVAGVRGDFFDFDVHSKTQPLNSGHKGAALVSPKLSLIFGPWVDSELFLNLGYGYHSNDARGTTLTVDPTTGRTGQSVSPLVRSRGAEIGVRSQYVRGLNTTLAVWWLQMDSELVFTGDAGTTEPTGKSERYGVEWTNYYKPMDWLTLDADFAFTAANYTDVAHNKSRIPNSVRRVISAGAVVELPLGFFTTARIRHFGDVPLNEDNSANAGDTTLVNLGAGYQKDFYKLEVDIFNLFGSKSPDIAYYYNSRTRGEIGQYQDHVGVGGVLYHPVEPRMVRVTATIKF